MTLLSLADLYAARDRIGDVALRTPLLPAPWAPGELLLKPESLQPIGAFKLRGAYNMVAALPPEVRARGVVTHSSGNHAQAVAYAARAFGVPAVVVMPQAAAPVKVAATRALGAEVLLVANAERESAALAVAAERGLTVVPPYDDPFVVAGQGTVGLEICEDAPDVRTVLVPVSGGGLLSGVAVAVAALCPGARVVGVEPELAGDAAESFRRGERMVWSPERTFRTLADGLRTTSVGVLPWEHIQALVADVVTVTEAEIRAAMRVLATRARLVVEPSGAVAVAAYLGRGRPPAGRTVAVLSGGNVDPALLAEVLAG
ncbi:MAG: threonine ammonia-lyase [Actinomycetota bacterium]